MSQPKPLRPLPPFDAPGPPSGGSEATPPPTLFPPLVAPASPAPKTTPSPAPSHPGGQASPPSPTANRTAPAFLLPNDAAGGAGGQSAGQTNAAPRPIVNPVVSPATSPVVLPPTAIPSGAAPAPAPGTASPAGQRNGGFRPTVNAAVAPARPATAAVSPARAAARPVAKPNGTAAIGSETEEHEPEVAELIVRRAPPWLISMVIHTVALLVAALWYLPQEIRRRVELQMTYADTLGEQLQNDTLQMPSLEPVDIPEPIMSKDSSPANDPLAAPPKLDLLLPNSPGIGVMSPDLKAPSIGLALKGREKGAKEALLGAYGGTALTEDSVRLALEWLKSQQQKNGSWSLTGPYSDGGPLENPTSATAMAMLAFQGAGHTHTKGSYKREMDRAVRYMIKLQDRDGNFFREGPEHHRLYSQAQATIAICELYGMTKDSLLRQPAQRAVDYACKVQADDGNGGGGWRYQPKRDVDTSVTGWFVMALQSARMADLEVPRDVLYKVEKYLDNVAHDGGSTYSYRANEGPTVTMTAEALLCRQYLGWAKEDPRLRTGIDVIKDNPIDWKDQNTYYWYYATQVLHHVGGDDWFRWNDVMREVLPKGQVKNGNERGSWDPRDDRWGSHGGRLYQTCLCVFMLEVYYRHLPIYHSENLKGL